MLSRIRALLLGVATVLAVTLSLTAALPSSAQAATGAKPMVGQCHQLSYRQAYAASDAKKAVSCSSKHDLQTIAVLTSPTSLDGLSDDQLSDAGAACDEPYARAVGRPTKRALTAYSLWTFVPTAAQRAAGARWIRCDVALLQGARLAPLPRHRLPKRIVSGHIADSVRLCLTSRKWYTNCGQRHAFRVMKAFEMPATSDYPSRQTFIDAAKRRCPSGWNYASWGGETSWSAGWHVVRCFDKTKK